MPQVRTVEICGAIHLHERFNFYKTDLSDLEIIKADYVDVCETRFFKSASSPFLDFGVGGVRAAL